MNLNFVLRVWCGLSFFTGLVFLWCSLAAAGCVVNDFADLLAKKGADGDADVWCGLSFFAGLVFLWCSLAATGCVVNDFADLLAKKGVVWLVVFCRSGVSVVFSGYCGCCALLLFLVLPLAAASVWGFLFCGFLSFVAFLFVAFVGGLFVFFSWAAALSNSSDRG
ncbi:hypothetical protein Q3G72_002016 [Acer saccharum]|nr:hypothetical protein Q3G72_002016 [Acer saccharum]